jgi:hypothetical protein
MRSFVSGSCGRSGSACGGASRTPPRLIVVGQLLAPAEAVPAGDIVALGPDATPEAIVHALRGAARKIDAIRAP